MRRIFGGTILSMAVVCGAMAQAPGGAPATPPAGGARDAAASTVSTEVRTGSGDLRDQSVTNTNRAPSTVPGRGAAPMNIRLHDGGVKMPKCAEESREGMACK
jgi:hypothetical protein